MNKSQEEVLLLEDIQEILDDIILRPFGQEQTWHFTVQLNEADHDFVLLTLINNFAWDSRTFDFDNEEGPQGSVLDMHSQSFTRVVWRSGLRTRKDIDNEVVHLTAYAFAHESLEWLRRWEGNEAVLIHDPHTDEDGDVSVII